MSCIFDVYNFSKIVHNYAYLTTNFLKECTKFCIFNLYNFSIIYIQGIQFFQRMVHSICISFQRMYTIFYNQCTQFLNNINNSIYSM